MALFERTIQDLSGGLTQPEQSRLESVVLQHELGHILGLVNAGTAMVTNHQDAPHGRHCTNTNCLMHYTVETGNVVQNLLDGSLPQLDSNCLSDLRANGGK
jgi:predicted Zn-dependent protease